MQEDSVQEQNGTSANPFGYLVQFLDGNRPEPPQPTLPRQVHLIADDE